MSQKTDASHNTRDDEVLVSAAVCYCTGLKSSHEQHALDGNNNNIIHDVEDDCCKQIQNQQILRGLSQLLTFGNEDQLGNISQKRFLVSVLQYPIPKSKKLLYLI